MNAIGVMLNSLDRDRLRAFDLARSLGFEVVHANALPEAWLQGPARDAYIRTASASGLTIATLFVGFDGQDYSSMRSIAATVGLVQPELRPHRLAVARRYIDLAVELGVPSLSMHLGFLPESPKRERGSTAEDGSPKRQRGTSFGGASGSQYAAIVDGLRGLLDAYAEHGLAIHLETGQDSAADQLAFIRRVDRPNLFVNFDPANFLIYGTDEPLGALEVLFPLIRGVHCKDGIRSEVPDELGRETPLGEGTIDFGVFLRRLSAFGFVGPLVIEREQAGNAADEVLRARHYLEALLKEKHEK
jgi:sugar phosphate isomerase/epimerase